MLNDSILAALADKPDALRALRRETIYMIHSAARLAPETQMADPQPADLLAPMIAHAACLRALLARSASFLGLEDMDPEVVATAFLNLIETGEVLGRTAPREERGPELREVKAMAAQGRRPETLSEFIANN